MSLRTAFAEPPFRVGIAGTPRSSSGTASQPTSGDQLMRRFHTMWPVLMSAGLLTNAAAQATGLPSFNAPYRAFSRSELGVVLTFPNGGGTAIEGAYRISSAKFDLGFRGGIFDPGGGANTVLLLGAEARERVVTDREHCPLVDSLIVGLCGGLVRGK